MPAAEAWRGLAAFCLYADIGHLTEGSERFCRKMLDEAGVATTPGVDFDPARGARTMRFSFAGGTEEMREAVGEVGTVCRIETFEINS